MKISDYIIFGGENLNDPPRKTPDFSEKAEKIFLNWYRKLARNSQGDNSFFELPIDETARLFIRTFWVERSGYRSVCYYVGLLISKDIYKEVKSYYKINRGLYELSFDNIKNAANHLAPIPVNIDYPEPRSTIGHEFVQLSAMKKYGDTDFNKNLDEMRFAISINAIEEWFTRLFIAVNPYQIESDFHIIISKKLPVKMPETKVQTVQESYQKIANKNNIKINRGNDQNMCSSQASITSTSCKMKCHVKIIYILLFIFVLFFNYNIYQGNKELEQKYTRLNAENIKLQNELSVLKKQLNNLQEKNEDIQKNIKKNLEKLVSFWPRSKKIFE